MTRRTHLWLIRIYAALIIVLVLTDPLEGVGFQLLTTIAAAGIVVQSFALNRPDMQDRDVHIG